MKKKIKIKFFFFLWGTKGRKSNSYGPPKEKIWNFFFNYFQKKQSQLLWIERECPLWWIWAYLRWIWRKNLKISEKIFFSNFQKKRSQLLWIERKCPLWWIWTYLRWIDNFWKKTWKIWKNNFFLAILWKKVSIALNWKKVSIMMNLSIFEMKWWFLEKKSEIFFFNNFQKKLKDKNFKN